MNDLEKTHNHAREMATPGAHTRECPLMVSRDRYMDWHLDLRVFACSSADDHEGHAWMQPDSYRTDQSWQRWCHGVCSGCVSDAERALWTQIADEISEYVSRPDDGQEALL